jgi:toxin FitB
MSAFLLDTNVVSETVRLRPDPRVTEWIARQPNSALFLSVLTIGELRRGFTIAPDPERRARLERWLENDVLRWFEGRILPVTQVIAQRWGVIDGTCQLRGTTANTADGLIAATALEHGLTVATRNVKDFSLFGVPFLNPWEEQPQRVSDPRPTP